MDVLREAWKYVRNNHVSSGVDEVSVEDVARESDAILGRLQTDLMEWGYRPSPLKRVYIPKSNGKKRGLAIPTVRDKIVQATVRMLIESIFESSFEPNSFGFRPKKSANDAGKEVTKYLNYGCEHVIDADIMGCFDNIPRNGLME